MATKITLKSGGGREIQRLRRFIADPSPLFKKLGLLMVAAAQKAFTDQALGEHKWKRRYPNQSSPPPKINVAGAVSDLRRGSNIKPHRFTDTPTLSLKMQRAVNYKVNAPNTIEVGTFGVPFDTAVHQFGGQTKQPVNQAVRDNLSKFLKRERNRAGRFGRHVLKETGIPGGKVLKEMGDTLKAERGRDLSARLGFLFNKNRTELVTRVNARPFLGFTDKIKDNISVTCEEFVVQRIQGGAGGGEAGQA